MRTLLVFFAAASLTMCACDSSTAPGDPNPSASLGARIDSSLNANGFMFAVRDSVGPTPADYAVGTIYDGSAPIYGHISYSPSVTGATRIRMVTRNTVRASPDDLRVMRAFGRGADSVMGAWADRMRGVTSFATTQAEPWSRTTQWREWDFTVTAYTDTAYANGRFVAIITATRVR